MDPRDRQQIEGDWYESLDEKKMKLEVMLDDETGLCVEFPFRWAVCKLCEGKGKHVNPSIDAHGISGEEFYEDRDFAEDYQSGVYDVPCYRCEGRRVEPEIEEHQLSNEDRALLDAFRKNQDERAKDIAEREREQRMGY